MIRGIDELLQNFRRKFGKPKNVLEDLKEKYQCEPDSDLTNNKEAVTEAVENEYEKLYFSDDEEKNKQQFEKLMQTYKETKSQLLEVFSGMDDCDIYEKLFNQYEDKLCKLQKKDIWDNPEKLASELIRILRQTLIKIWIRKNAQNILRNYFKINGFEVIDFEKKHTLTNDDIAYLDGMYLSCDKEETDDKSKDYEVIEMIQPVIKVAYDDDGDREYKSIPGRCKCYIYTR